MKKLINDPTAVVTETLEGFAAAHADLVTVHLDPDYVVRADAPKPGKVGLVSGGGSALGRAVFLRPLQPHADLRDHRHRRDALVPPARLVRVLPHGDFDTGDLQAQATVGKAWNMRSPASLRADRCAGGALTREIGQ